MQPSLPSTRFVSHSLLSHRHASCLIVFSPIDTLRVLQSSVFSPIDTLRVLQSSVFSPVDTLRVLITTFCPIDTLHVLQPSRPSTLFVSYSLNSLPSTLFVSYSLNFLPSTLFVSYCLLPTTLFVSDSLLPIFTLRVLITTVSPPVILRVLQSSFSPTRTGHSWQNSLMLRTHSIPYLF